MNIKKISIKNSCIVHHKNPLKVPPPLQREKGFHLRRKINNIEVLDYGGYFSKFFFLLLLILLYF